MTQQLWTPDQLVQDLRGAGAPGERAILVMVKTEFCHTNPWRLCTVTTAALEKRSTPVLRGFRVYGAWVKGNPDHTSAAWRAWEAKVIDAYRFEQGPGAKLVAILPGKGVVAETNALEMNLIAEELEKDGGRTPTLEAWLTAALNGAGQAKAADFELTGLKGQKISLAANAGKVVVLDFFATWCPPCRASTPFVVGLDKTYGARGLKVIAVDMAESRGPVEAYVRDHGMGYDVAIDAGDVARKYAVAGIPTFVVVNKDGTVRAKLVGFDPDALEGAVKQALAAK